VISSEQRRVASQLSPGRTHTPQLALQQYSPTLQVFGPQKTLDGTTGMPQMNCEHSSPGFAQMPQLGLQHTLPEPQVVAPHVTTAGAAAADGAAEAVGAAELVALALGAAAGARADSLTSTVGSTWSTIGCGNGGC